MIEGIGESLFNLLRVVCRGLEGQSAALDQSLSQLRTHMMNSEDVVPEEIVKKIEQGIHVLHLERHENAQDFLTISSTWLRELKHGDFADPQQKQLKIVTEAFKDKDKSLYGLPAKFKLLLDIQLTTNKLSVQSLSEDGNADSLKKVTAEFIQLLGLISPSKTNLVRYKVLITELEQGLELDKIPEVINKITSFLETEKATKGEDFSNYLQSLNKQLSEVQGFISKTQIVDSNSAKIRSVADGAIRDSVINIRESVAQATQIEVLKEELSVQLSHIVGAVDSIKAEEVKREDSLLASYNALKLRVNIMEKEAEKVQDFIVEERKQARLDALTGLPNRTAYNEIMAHQIEQFGRYQKQLTLVICDLDHFKRVNDSYGHLAGDKVLSLVAKILDKGTRNADFVTRYGGEEFAVILPSTNATQAAEAMNKIRRLLCKSPFNFRGEPISISMSFGVSEAVVGDGIESLFLRADAALYKAKENGRNNVCIG
ncbi:MAG: GGDEF domain-containing protein [Oceanospirillaceae bacterium]|nr:GGDEF domain-containing protein [Oceanospirillaceae bacterium]